MTYKLLDKTYNRFTTNRHQEKKDLKESPTTAMLHDYFEVSPVDIGYNTMEHDCPNCSIKETCMLKKRKYDYLCFPNLRQLLVSTDVFDKVLNKVPLSAGERDMNLYIDAFLYHLDKYPNANTHPNIDYMDICTDCIYKGSPLESFLHLDSKVATLRIFGHYAIGILRARGYNF